MLLLTQPLQNDQTHIKNQISMLYLMNA